MNLSLTGKTAIVCGSTQGIGYASAVELALLGANVTLLARNEEKLQEVIGSLDTKLGQKHQYRVADFANPEEVKTAIDAYLIDFPDVHILINNTGGPAGGPLIDAKLEEFTQTFAAHLLNNQILAQAVVPSMKRAGYGRIVNIISTSVKQPIVGLGVSNTFAGRWRSGQKRCRWKWRSLALRSIMCCRVHAYRSSGFDTGQPGESAAQITGGSRKRRCRPKFRWGGLSNRKRSRPP
jgi:3-oxoacyl-[acyl-carrier protein] reductase